MIATKSFTEASSMANIIKRPVVVGIAAALAVYPMSLLLGWVTVSGAKYVLPPSTIEDFRAGELAVSGQFKTLEPALPLIAFGIPVLIFFLVYRRLNVSDWSRLSYAAVYLLAAYSSLAVLATMVGNVPPLVAIPEHPLILLIFLQLGPAAAWALRSWKPRVSSRATGTDPGPYLALAAAAPLTSLGLMAASRNLMAPSSFARTLALVIAISIVLLVVIALWRVFEGVGVSNPRTFGLAFTVLSIPALFLLLPPVLVVDGSAMRAPGSVFLPWVLLIFSISLALFFEFWIRSRRTSPEGPWYSSLTSIGLVGFLVPLHAIYGQPAVGDDDYHGGEILSPWAMWVQNGQVPYIDTFLPRGAIINVVPAALNSALNDGSMATISTVMPVIALLVGTIAHLIIRAVAGVALATGVVAIIAVANFYIEGDLLVMAVLILALAIIATPWRPLLSGAILSFLAALGIVAYPLMGTVTLAGIFGCLIVAAVGSTLMRNSTAMRSSSTRLIAFIVAGAVILFSPVGAPIIAGIEYVVANASANEEAYGVSIERMFSLPLGLGHLLSFAFVLGIGATLFAIGRLLGGEDSSDRPPAAKMGIAVVPAGFVVALIGRYMGRVDAYEWSYRPAAGTLIVLGVLVPVVLILLLRDRGVRAAWVSLGIAAIVAIAILPIGNGSVFRSAVFGVYPSAGYFTTAQDRDAVLRLGYGAASSEHIASLVEISQTGARLVEGEVVLNLTNRGSLFAYMGWTNPIKYLAPYNIESAESESAVVRQLDLSPPSFALVSPGPQYDGVSLALRNPELAGWVMENYVPITCGTATWGVHMAEFEVRGYSALDCSYAPLPEVADRSAIWAAAIGAPAELGNIPAFWGSRARIADKHDIARAVRVEPGEAYASDGLMFRGGEIDLLILQVACDQGHAVDPLSKGVLTVGGQEVSRFNMGEGLLVVPLDAYPAFRNLLRVSGSYEFTPLDSCDGAAVLSSWGGERGRH